MSKLGLLLIFSTLVSISIANNGGLIPLLEWKDIEFRFPSERDRLEAIRKGLYVPGNSLPIDVDVHYGANDYARIFITMPRFTTGIPFTVATVSNSRGSSGPFVEPYPHYAWHQSHGQDCTGITSVYRVAIDECDRIWILDTGRIGRVQHCSPQLLVFDLKRDTLLHRYKFPQSQFKIAVSLFVTPMVDVRDPPPHGRCRQTMVYIADVTGFGLVVYDFGSNKSWRIENKLMYPTPDYGTFTIAGESFDLMDGILGLSLTPQSRAGGMKNNGGRNEVRNYYGGGGSSRPSSNAERQLYFHSLGGSVQNRVPLNLIDNSTIWADNSEARPRDFITIGDRGTQSAPSAMDKDGNMYFGLMEDIAIASWDITTPYKRSNFKMVAQNFTTLQFVSGLKIKTNRLKKEELWAMSCRFQKVFTGTKDPQEINFRVLGCSVDELRNGGCSSNRAKDNSIIFPGYN